MDEGAGKDGRGELFQMMYSCAQHVGKGVDSRVLGGGRGGLRSSWMVFCISSPLRMMYSCTCRQGGSIFHHSARD